MEQPDLTSAAWRKSSRSTGANSTCVEVAELDDGRRAVRNSNDRTGPMVIFTGPEWAAFADGVRDGEFD